MTFSCLIIFSYFYFKKKIFLYSKIIDKQLFSICSKVTSPNPSPPKNNNNNNKKENGQEGETSTKANKTDMTFKNIFAFTNIRSKVTTWPAASYAQKVSLEIM